MSTTNEFDSALKRLDNNLQELESVSNHLNDVKTFTDETKKLGSKFAQHLEESSKLVEKSTKNLDKFVSENGAKIKELTDSHQQLAGRVKDMEDKVTVLNTKTEAMSKEIGIQIVQVRNVLEEQIESFKKKHEKYHRVELENIDLNKKVMLYLLIPVLLFLVYISVVITL